MNTALPTPAWMAGMTTVGKLGRPDSILIFGPESTRKTSTAASIRKVPGFERVLMIDTEGRGAKVLSRDPALADIGIRDIDTTKPFARQQISAIIDDITTNDYGFQAVIWDTLDVSQAAVKRDARATNLAQSGNTNGWAAMDDMTEWTDLYVRKLHNCPFFVSIVTAHSKEFKIKTGGMKIAPALEGQARDTIASIPDLVIYSEKVRHPETNELHILSTMESDSSVTTKNRWSLPPQMLDIDLPTIYNLIDEQIAGGRRTPAPAIPDGLFPVPPEEAAGAALPATQSAPASTPVAA